MSDWHAQRFDRAARAYERVTPVQKDMAHRLAGLLPGELSPRTIVEFGCGTGHLTRELLHRFPRASFLCTDLAPSMLEACSASLSEWDRPRVRLAILDAREPVLHESDIDLVTSSAMVQWFPDLQSHLRAVSNLLLPGGYYLLSGFCHSNFPELDQILSAEPFSYPPPPGHFLSDAVQFAQDAGFSVQLQEQDTIELAYPSALEFLRAIAQAGASRTPRDGKPLTRSALSTLVDRYQQMATLPDGRVRATWKPWYLLLKRD